MHARGNKLGVYTTIYPAVLKYLPEWYESVRKQTDTEFELWIGLDALKQDDVEARLGGGIDAHWVEAEGNATPALIRDRALRQMTGANFDVVLVDSDDVLHPTRVAAARQALRESDLAGCALEIVDESGASLGSKFNLDPSVKPAQVLPRNNVFGFSNSALRCELLERCLPIPPDTVLVDWYIATRAWLFGAELSFDHSVRMKYRQYGANTARVRVPFWPDQIVSDSLLVRKHFQLVMASGPQSQFLPGRWTELLRVARDIEQFEGYISQSTANLNAYVDSLNRAVKQPIWWTSVAYSPLAHMWKQEKSLCRQ
ncbi:hypothetical protein [Occallatibacter savannae]|uniref:hypothetical protein n=1 Tax=Occallatibacter savannae TaxID=1002691 RepID=UPI000D69E2B0|nr:hypothetical protein [Occallatibacter savannae]